MLALRPYTPLRMVLTICGRCFSDDPDREIDYEADILQGNLVAQDGRVLLRRFCRRGHGEVTSLYEEDVNLWEDLQQWRIPTREIVPDRPANARPIPMGYLDGLGDLQTQHSCILLLDVTENCNLECPTCFAVSGPGNNRHAPVRHILHTLDTAIEREGGKVDALMLSGGEPTVHPEIVEIIRGATDRAVTRVVLNTNGIRIARDDRFLGELARLRDRVEVYLQFDGFRRETYLYHRGEDLREMKAAAIGRLTDARIFTTLAVAIAKGVNDDETGAIVDYAFGTDYIGGVALQPMFTTGRANEIDPLDRATTTGTIRRLGQQTGGRIGPDDFIALPCSHPDCSALTYFVRGDDGNHRSVVQLIGRDRLKEQMVVFGNRLAPDDALWESLTGLMSETAMVSRPELIDYLLDVCEACDLGVRGFIKNLGRWLADRSSVPVEHLARRVKRLSVKTFMDPWTLNIERLQQCCVHVGSTDGGDPVRIPFCARQIFGGLRRRTSAGMVPARQLVSLDGATAGPPRPAGFVEVRS
jgi:hypothetical protein